MPSPVKHVSLLRQSSLNYNTSLSFAENIAFNAPLLRLMFFANMLTYQLAL